MSAWGEAAVFLFQLLSRCFYSFTTTFQTAQQPEFLEGMTFPQSELHMHVRISAALATYLGRPCSLSAADQVWNQFLCLKWSHTLVYTLLCCRQWEEEPPAGAQNERHPSLKATSFHVGNMTNVVALALVCLPEASRARDNVGESGGAAGTVR